MLDVLEVALSMLVGTVGTILIVAWDERRLGPEARDRAWPIATRLSAAFAFGPLALPVHFFRTRRSVLGTLLGVFVAAAVVLVIEGLSLALHALAG